MAASGSAQENLPLESDWHPRHIRKAVCGRTWVIRRLAGKFAISKEF
jgi:hypothetical protein